MTGKNTPACWFVGATKSLAKCHCCSQIVQNKLKAGQKFPSDFNTRTEVVMRVRAFITSVGVYIMGCCCGALRFFFIPIISAKRSLPSLVRPHMCGCVILYVGLLLWHGRVFLQSNSLLLHCFKAPVKWGLYQQPFGLSWCSGFYLMLLQSCSYRKLLYLVQPCWK